MRGYAADFYLRRGRNRINIYTYIYLPSNLRHYSVLNTTTNPSVHPTCHSPTDHKKQSIYKEPHLRVDKDSWMGCMQCYDGCSLSRGEGHGPNDAVGEIVCGAIGT